MSKFRLILSADWHLRDDTPRCRERDEYLAAQERKLKFIHDLCEENGAAFLVAGDLFDNWKPSPWLISLALRYIPPGTVVVAGQHDIPGHNLSEIGKTGLQTLAEAGVAIILSGGLRRVLGHSNTCLGAVYGYSYGEQAQNPPKGDEGVKILMWHRLTCLKAQPWPGADAETSHAIQKDFSDYSIILVGDNHQQFSVKDGEGKWIVNPGSLCRMTSDQADFEPAVFGWSEDETITRIPLPIEKGVVKITKSNGKAKESRDARMEAYIKRAGRQLEDRLSFIANLKQHFKTNKETKGVETIVWKACETNEK
ncbi:MAG: metallophosphoesterase [Dehalococcoidia bacterium]